MPKSLIVFAVSFTPETPNFGTFGRVAQPLEEYFNFLKFLLLNCVYAHISNLNYKNILILKKKEFGHFRVQNPYMYPTNKYMYLQHQISLTYLTHNPYTFLQSIRLQTYDDKFVLRNFFGH